MGTPETCKTVLFHTLGCKLNYAETASMAQIFADHGIKQVGQEEQPDYVVVNTCTVTAEADKKCRQAIRSLSRQYPNASIIVTGCYAQLSPEEALAQPGVTLVAGNDRKEQLVNYLQASHAIEITPSPLIRTFQPICSCGNRTRYFLKVQDGCDYFCTYCTIPKARGRSRSASISDTVKVAREAIDQGAKEIVITGVNTGDFGHGTTENFLALCQELDKLEGIERYRISSIEPNLLSDAMIEFVAQSRHFMPHFHLPLQSGSNEVLKLMRRRYDTDLFRERVTHIRQLLPHAFIGVDLMVGTRGETEALFQQSHDFVKSLPISRLHVFPYSERPGTAALSIPHVVTQEDKHRRASVMINLSNEKLKEFAKPFIGTMRKVLVEHSLEGFTDNYLRVTLPAGTLPNTVVKVNLNQMDDESHFSASLVMP